MKAWFKDMISGLESLSLDSEADRETLWMALESTLSGMRTTRVNDLISDEAKARAMEYETKHKITQMSTRASMAVIYPSFVNSALQTRIPEGN